MPCALKIGGIYVGTTGGAEKFMDIDPTDKILCEFIPFSPLYKPVSFVVDDDFKPSKNVREYFLPGAIALYARDFFFADSSMRLIKQEKYSDCAATLFAQGKVFASVENAEGIFTFELNDTFLKGEIYRREGCIIFYSGSYLAIISIRGKMEIFTPVLSCEFSATVKAEIPAGDCLKHSFFAEWILSDGVERIKYSPSPSVPAPKELAIIALAEGILKGFDVSPYVTEALYKRLDALKNFFGDYKDVIYLGENLAGLAYERDSYAYSVIPFTASLTDGKVDNVKESEGAL